MAIRDKLRAKFSKNKSSPGDATPDSSSSGEVYYTGRKDITYYKPHEIPKSKYRGRIDKDHQDKLEAYSFTDAFQTIQRRASTALSGTFSPGGSKALSAAPSAAASAAPSRRASWISKSRSSVSSLGGRSTASGGSGHDGTVSRRRSKAGVKLEREVSDISENSDDDTDIQNAGLSRTVTARPNPHSQRESNIEVLEDSLDRQATVTTKPQAAREPQADLPFTPEELERAMSKARLGASHHENVQDRKEVAVSA